MKSERPRSCALTASADSRSGRLAGKFTIKPSDSWAVADLRLDFLDGTLYSLLEEGFQALRFAVKGDGLPGVNVQVEVSLPPSREKHRVGSFGLDVSEWRQLTFSLRELAGNKQADSRRVSLLFMVPAQKRDRPRSFWLDNLCLVREPRSDEGMDVFGRTEADECYPRFFLDALARIDHPASEPELRDIANRRQLFVDDFIIDDAQGLSRTFHQARKHAGNPLIYPGKGKAGSFLYVYGSVLRDDGKGRFRMWYYQAEYRGGRSGGRYAESPDGVHWTLTDRRMPFITLGVVTDSANIGLARRFQVLAPLGGSPVNPYGVFFSLDGLNWRAHEGNPVLRVRASDVNPTIRDPQSGYYVSFVKVPVNAQRTVGISFSKDFISWTDPISVFVPDDLDRHMIRDKIAAARNRGIISHDDPIRYTAEVYGLGCMPYDGLYLGIPWMYFQCGPVPGGGSDGVIEPQLMSTRDFVKWHRTGNREPLIPLGKRGEWDCGMITTVNRPITVGDEIWIYYGGFNIGHGDDALFGRGPADPAKRAGIGLATLRRDGFVSLDADQQTGTLLTKPFRFTGNSLRVNCDASRGEVTVEVLDAQSRTLPSFTRANCEAIKTDAVNQTVRWHGTPDLSKLVGTPIRLRVTIRNARLYALQFEHAATLP